MTAAAIDAATAGILDDLEAGRVRAAWPDPATPGTSRLTSFPIEPADTRRYACNGEMRSGSSPHTFRENGK